MGRFSTQWPEIVLFGRGSLLILQYTFAPLVLSQREYSLLSRLHNKAFLAVYKKIAGLSFVPPADNTRYSNKQLKIRVLVLLFSSAHALDIIGLLLKEGL